MGVTVIVGTQFGDEGKGKTVDYYAKDMDLIVRYNGGTNAGHTVVVGKKMFKFRLLPSGVIRPDKIVVIGNGVVVDPMVLISEINQLKRRRINSARILLSDRAHLIMPYHKLIDTAEEKLKGKLRAGTTKRGIGPCYSDKVARFGIRVIDLLEEQTLSDKLNLYIPIKEKLLAIYGEKITFSKEYFKKQYLHYGTKLAPYVEDTISFLHEAILQRKKILLEGAQGTFLDIDYGIYPFGTSSNAVSGGACTGSGIPPNKINRVIGVVKAYTSRVGEGPFVTELRNDLGNQLREKGQEFGTVTGRPRRCGWLDMTMLNYAIRVNGVSALALTKVDVLSGIEKIKICVAYESNGEKLKEFPSSMRILSECRPVYEELCGWKEYSKQEWLLFAKKGYDALHKNLKRYVEFIEEQAGIPIELISIGPERKLTIDRRI